MTERPWRVRFGAVAKKDFARILKYTKDSFGERQAAVYKVALLKTIARLAAGADAPGSHAREDLGRGLRSLHIAPTPNAARRAHRRRDERRIDAVQLRGVYREEARGRRAALMSRFTLSPRAVGVGIC